MAAWIWPARRAGGASARSRRPWAGIVRQCQRRIRAECGRAPRDSQAGSQGSKRPCTSVVSSGHTGTDGAVEASREAEDQGADALMVLPPYYLKTDADGLLFLLRGDQQGCPHPHHDSGRPAHDAGGDAAGAAGSHGARDRAREVRQGRGAAHRSQFGRARRRRYHRFRGLNGSS